MKNRDQIENFKGKIIEDTLFDEEECQIKFTDGTVLLIASSGASGYIELLVYELKKEKSMDESYWAVFKTTSEAVEVFFPDLKGCTTFGNDVKEALDMAEDALSGYLEVCEEAYIVEPSTYDDIYEKYGNKKNVNLIKVKSNPIIKETYQKEKS